MVIVKVQFYSGSYRLTLENNLKLGNYIAVKT